METTKFNNLAVKVIGYIGYFLMTAFMTIFGILAVLALGLTFIEKDIFNLVGFTGCALVTWVMYTLRKSMIS